MGSISRLSSPIAKYWLRFSIDFNRRLRALVGGILAGRLEFLRHWVHFGVGLVVSSHFKDLGSYVRTNPTTNAEVRVNSRFHHLILLSNIEYA